MKRKILSAMCCAALLFALAGCQLAREDAGADMSEDKMIGVFITSEHLNLFDMESYLNDNLKGFSGGEIVMDGKSDQYQGRLYATLKARTLTNEDTGDTQEIEEYVFENVAGISYFAPTIQGKNGVYTSSASDEALSDGHMAINNGDETKSITMDGTLYVLPARTKVYYLNPVYQSTDGSVYLTSGSGISSSGMHSEGLMMSTTLDAVYTVIENGKTKTDSFSVTISVSFMFKPEKIAVLQMDANGILLSRKEYAPDKVPETFTSELRTEYLIVETYKYDIERTSKVSRQLYSRNETAFDFFSVRDDGVCVKHWSQIMW